jgi:hypothetical protein
MEYLDNFSFILDKYIILYSDISKEDNLKLCKNIKEIYNIEIVKFLSVKEIKINDPLINEIYIDISIEDILIKNSFCVIYI